MKSLDELSERTNPSYLALHLKKQFLQFSDNEDDIKIRII